jgi:hypothetical protein
MSISSCPRCAQPISLPAGVSTTAKVRCPLCRAQYTLADAAANMPPMLEVIEEAPAGVAGVGFELPPDPGVEGKLDIAPRSELAETVEMAAMQESQREVPPLADTGHSDSADEELVFEAPEIEHDDLTMQEQDTEIEDFNFATSDPLVREAPLEIEHLELAKPDEESVLDLGADPPADDEPAHDALAGEGIEIDFDHVPSVDQPAVAEEVEFDFDASETVDPERTIVGSELAAAQPQMNVPETGLSFGEALSGQDRGDQETIELDFGNGAPLEKPAEEAEMPLEFGEPIEAEPTPVTVADSSPAAEEKSKKKKKKVREKAPAKSGRQGSLVRTLVSLVVCSVVALPLVLYGVLWIDKDYDLVGLGGWLPASMLPANFGKTKSFKSIATAPIPQPLSVAPQPTGPVAVEPVPAAVDTAMKSTQKATPEQAAGPAEPAATETVVAPKSTATAPAAADAVRSKSDDTPPEPPASESAGGSDQPGHNEKPGNPAALSAVAAGQPAPAGDDKPANSAASPDDMPSPFDSTNDSKPDEMPEPFDTAEPAEALGPRNAPELMLADVSAAIEALKTANKTYVSSQQSTDETAIKKARAQFYVSLFSLAESLTFAKDDPSNPQLEAMRNRMQAILLQFFGDDKRVEALGTNAASWLGYAKRNVAGVVFVGTVQDIQQVDKLFHVKVELTSGKPTTVTVVTPEEPRLKANDRALVLGSIVENPAQQIAGYEGDEAAVVWSGMAVPLPAVP